eukprot:XP_011671214.1 PREDICTED: uncharacterized protein LOC105441623 [Strongylocentrotus purpuratus]
MPKKPKFPYCGKNVAWKSKGIQCEGECEQWFHAECINFNSTDYSALGTSSIVWICNICGVHNISRSDLLLPSAFSSNLSSQNLFSYLNHTDIESCTTNDSKDEGESDDSLCLGSPKFSSSPRTSKKKPNNPTKPKAKVLTILNVNCQSIRAKKQSFAILIHQHNPDVVIGTESWLTEDIRSSEVFPTDHYNIERRDRPNDPHGGVFLAIRKDLLASREIELETDCELIWCKISMPGAKTLHVAAFYRPHEGDEMSLTELERSLSRLSPTHSVVIGGDLNLPGWDWRNQQVGNCRYPNLHRRLGSLLDDHGLTQVVTEPTRYQNTLDLLLVSNPTVVNEVTVVPGVSDHDCPLVKLDVRPTRRHQMRRKVLLYSKAQWEKFGESMEAVRDEIEAKVTYASMNELWLIFKTGIEKGINDFIPQKLTPHKANLPWVTNGIRRLIKKRDRLSNKRKQLQKREGLISYAMEEQLCDLKRTLKSKLRKAYWNYVESIFTSVEDDDEGPEKYNCMKRFWQFIKHNRTDSDGFAGLKSDGLLISEPAEKADALNRQFKKVFTQEIPIPHL